MPEGSVEYHITIIHRQVSHLQTLACRADRHSAAGAHDCSFCYAARDWTEELHHNGTTLSEEKKKKITKENSRLSDFGGTNYDAWAGNIPLLHLRQRRTAYTARSYVRMLLLCLTCSRWVHVSNVCCLLGSLQIMQWEETSPSTGSSGVLSLPGKKIGLKFCSKILSCVGVWIRKWAVMIKIANILLKIQHILNWCRGFVQEIHNLFMRLWKDEYKATTGRLYKAFSVNWVFYGSQSG